LRNCRRSTSGVTISLRSILFIGILSPKYSPQLVSAVMVRAYPESEKAARSKPDHFSIISFDGPREAKNR